MSTIPGTALPGDPAQSLSNVPPARHKACVIQCVNRRYIEVLIEMSIPGLGSTLASLGAQYNFKSMTNQQFLTAVTNLGNEGKISQSDASQLSFIAQGVDSVPISGPSPSVSQVLNDPTMHNFLSELQGDDDSANRPGAVGGALYDRMLKAIESYQESSVEDTAGQAHSVKV